MRTYLSPRSDGDLVESHRHNLCDRLRLRAAAAEGNPALLEMLAKESQAMSCDIPQLDEWFDDSHTRRDRSLAQMKRQVNLKE